LSSLRNASHVGNPETGMGANLTAGRQGSLCRSASWETLVG
jgi:hypothetical protein